MLTRKSILTMTTAAALCAAPLLAQGQQSTGGSSAQPQATQTTPQQGPMSSTTGAETGRDASGGMQAQGGSAPGGGAAGRGTTSAQGGAAPDGTPGNPPSTATQRSADSVTGNTTPPDSTPGNPPGTAAGRAVDRALGTNLSGTNPEGANAGSSATGATTPGMEVDSVRLREGRRASRIIGSTVYNENNESIGEVDDLILTREGGQPTAVLSVGGFLGIGSRLVAVPLERLSWNAERERWSMPGATKDSLSGLPAFNYSERRG